MELLTSENLIKRVDYSFGDHHVFWDKTLTGEFKYANADNEEFLAKAKEFRGKVMTLFIDNIRLYPRQIESKEDDKPLIDYLMKSNNLLALCACLPQNAFVIYTGEEDTPIDNQISLPFNVVRVNAVNSVYNNDRIRPFPIGLQRKRTPTDNRLEIMKERVEKDAKVEPKKLLYINCGIERNPERSPLAKFDTNSWVTTRFDKDSRFFPFEAYNAFLDELQNHKFVVCPKGHGFDTHRIWETLYMRRVPVMIDHPYFQKLLKDFPAVFIKHWEELTPEFLKFELLEKMYEQAQTMDLKKLSLEKWFTMPSLSLTN